MKKEKEVKRGGGRVKEKGKKVEGKEENKGRMQDKKKIKSNK